MFFSSFCYTQEKEKWYPITFIGSICFIGLFSYLMLWWANEVGDTIGIVDEVSLKNANDGVSNRVKILWGEGGKDFFGGR